MLDAYDKSWVKFWVIRFVCWWTLAVILAVGFGYAVARISMTRPAPTNHYPPDPDPRPDPPAADPGARTTTRSEF